MELVNKYYDKPVTCWLFDEKSSELIEIDGRYLKLYGYCERKFLEQMRNREIPEKGKRVISRYLNDLNNNTAVIPCRVEGISFHALVYEEKVQFKAYDYIHVIFGKMLEFGVPIACVKMQAVFQRKVEF